VKNVSGAVVYKARWDWNRDSQLDLNQLAKGVYFLLFNGMDKTYKLMIK
jgi:hypothetical protein